MKALIWKTKEAGDVGVVEKPAHVPSDGEILVRVGCAGISGPDITIASGKHAMGEAPTHPRARVYG